MAESAAVSWVLAIRAIDEALSRGDVSAAVRTWPEAYVAALRSRRWAGLLEVGDARLSIDRVAGSAMAAEPTAREVYFTALLLAGRERSLEGVLRAAEAFEALGDASVVDHALRIAEAVAGVDPGPAARARLVALRKRRDARLAPTARGPEDGVAES